RFGRDRLLRQLLDCSLALKGRDRQLDESGVGYCALDRIGHAPGFKRSRAECRVGAVAVVAADLDDISRIIPALSDHHWIALAAILGGVPGGKRRAERLTVGYCLTRWSGCRFWRARFWLPTFRRCRAVAARRRFRRWSGCRLGCAACWRTFW